MPDKPSSQRVLRRWLQRQADSSHVEHSFVMFKPLALKTGMVPRLKSALEKASKGEFEECKEVRVTSGHISKHYSEHSSKPFFSSLVSYYEGKKVVACRIGGPRGTIMAIRRKLGPSNPVDCTLLEHLRALAIPYTPEKGSGETCGVDNLIHASDSKGASRSELKLWGMPVPRASSENEDAYHKSADTTRISKAVGGLWRRLLTKWVALPISSRRDSHRTELAASLGRQIVMGMKEAGVEVSGVEVQTASPQGARTIFILPDQAGIMAVYLAPGERGAWTAKSAGSKGKFLGADNLQEVVRNLLHYSR